ncbi:similar to Saccharomyces cerevisiae YMR314W PRE5 Alpha 6 subunit of the 20S proteasome [Maudiozyma barnettii]|uniref:Similar to Saccharomyces cerevisiae YMR314W PRE5 Alpha 6 subunit of the 20S proteasome n=1 Tax=Maudiozyma barnettii TaxID=61262 RepID=A0A8H2ZG52_9SACH|nr:proteasome core particle subunit alpha 6 [Kazachstania barnettii]CAB4253045.1 similar to Saccharomyces cerevisiae YMR314W PRE5 Alpha 6 subunit of the 20S proteasome [Kazachstania barnettii]CAD1780420.1 similar to Saccharomyces cerevisiae YMR314W PRE5 Alpha 6 subunit of the 20S proteasome [Kazachstania barnettii]
MFRNNYDGDTVTFSPTGRLFQVEYALEAIKQGSVTVGLRSKNHAVLVALKRNADELSSYQKKIIKCDSHMGLSLAGLAPDARVLSNYLRQQCNYSQLVYNRKLSVEKAGHLLSDKAQRNTQSYGGRPYGVGLLIVGYDNSGAHLLEFQPSGNTLELYGAAIGARSQGSKTYLERVLDEFIEVETADELIKVGIEALRQSLKDETLTVDNLSIAVVGKDMPFTMYDGENVSTYL